MKKLDNYHNNVLTVILIREEYIQYKNCFFLTAEEAWNVILFWK
jgi:hypothetical protein